MLYKKILDCSYITWKAGIAKVSSFILSRKTAISTLCDHKTLEGNHYNDSSTTKKKSNLIYSMRAIKWTLGKN